MESTWSCMLASLRETFANFGVFLGLFDFAIAAVIARE